MNNYNYFKYDILIMNIYFNIHINPYQMEPNRTKCHGCYHSQEYPEVATNCCNCESGRSSPQILACESCGNKCTLNK